MAISKTSGISLSEIKAHLKGTNGISSYKGIQYLNSKTNAVATVEGPSLSFSSFDHLTILPDNMPNAQSIGLNSSTDSTRTINQNTGDASLNVNVEVAPPSSQPILAYTAVPNKVNPTVQWYETTGGAYTLVSTNSYGHSSINVLEKQPGEDWFEYHERVGTPRATQASDGRYTFAHPTLGDIAGLTLTGLNQIRTEVANDASRVDNANWLLRLGHASTYDEAYAMALPTAPPSQQSSITFRSTFAVSDDAIGTRTFVAVAIATTSGVDSLGYDLGIKRTDQQEIATFSVTVVAPSAPVITSQTQNGGALTSSGTIITYDNGEPTSNPRLGVAFNYTFAESTSPGWIKTNRSESHVSYVSFDGGGWVASTASGVGPNGPFDQSHDPTRSPSEFGYWVGIFTFTTPGEYRFKLVSSVSVTFTKPDGTTGYVITGTDESIHTTTIGSTTVAEDKPTLVSWTLDKTTVTDEYKTITATLNTQHAIGQSITISDGWYTDYQSPSIWNSDRPITANSMTFTWTTQPSNSSATRTVSLTATPIAGDPAWNDDTAITKTCEITNTGEPTIVTSQTGVDVSTLDEGSAFTMTLVGVNFTENNYTWDTTLPAASVTATSGSFTTSFTTQNVYTGSFAVTSTTRATHYANETGIIRIYRDGILYHSSGTLTITNIHAEPVTLPTVTLSSISALASGGHSRESGYDGTVAVSVTLNNDSTFTIGRQGAYIGNNYGALAYASPIPLEGNWIPRIIEAGEIASVTSQEDIIWQPAEWVEWNAPGFTNGGYWREGVRGPSGFATASISFSDSTCTLNVQAENLFSSIHTSSCAFTWQFYNTDSKATITGGTITLTAMATNIPGWITTTPPQYWWIALGFATHALAMATGLYYEDGTLIPPVTVYWWIALGYATLVQALATGLYETDGTLKTTTTVVTAGWWIPLGYATLALAMATGLYETDGTLKTTTTTTVIVDSVTDGWWIAVGYATYAEAMASGLYYANGTVISTAGGVTIENGIVTEVNVITDDPTIDNDQEGGVVINTVYSPHGTYVTQHCVGTTLMGTYADGYGGSYNSVIAYNSPACGYEAEVAVQTAETVTVTDVDIAAAIAYLEANPINIDDIDFTNIVIDFSIWGGG